MEDEECCDCAPLLKCDIDAVHLTESLNNGAFSYRLDRERLMRSGPMSCTTLLVGLRYFPDRRIYVFH